MFCKIPALDVGIFQNLVTVSRSLNPNLKQKLVKDTFKTFALFCSLAKYTVFVVVNKSDKLHWLKLTNSRDSVKTEKSDQKWRRVDALTRLCV